jgi:hypothetical protein
MVSGSFSWPVEQTGMAASFFSIAFLHVFSKRE